MKSTQLSWANAADIANPDGEDQPDLILYFAPRSCLADGAAYQALRRVFPGAALLGCSGGGQILGDDIDDARIVGMAMKFRETRIKLAEIRVDAQQGSLAAGVALGRQLQAPDLAGMFILADGLCVNGTDLVAGVAEVVGSEIPLSGGLAGDDANFIQTLVGANRNPEPGMVAAVGFYGTAIRMGHGSAGGWSVFGPHRIITRADANILYELDGQPALDLYERYLGDEAAGLPGTALLFPLRIFDAKRPDHDIVRTILSVDRAARSMTFAGTMPVGWTAQLMRGTHDRLLKGAGSAGEQARLPENWGGEGAAFLVSCIGRRLLMGQRTSEEVLAVREALGAQMPTLGFYSYGEISPHASTGFSELHNQTMTVLTLCEAA